MSIEKYGLSWPDGTTDATIELRCYRLNHLPERGGLGPRGHLKEAICQLWPEQLSNNERGYLWHEWMDRRLDSWVRSSVDDWHTWWGPSSAGKSCDAGILALAHWLAAPDQTTVIVCSTTKDMLEKRIFGEIIRYHSLHKGKLPGEYMKSKHAIILGDENSKNGIFGIAIQKGTLSEALGNMIGIHNRYNVLIIDEMQSTREAAIDAADNLSTGEEFKLIGMGNPVSRLDPLGKYSEPLHGWESVSPNDEEWETKYGHCLYFDGLKSPAIKAPKKFYFLLNQKQIDALKKKRGQDSPAFWSQRRGFVPPEGLIESVLTESFIVRFHMQAPAKWKYGYRIVAGLDPAYSSGGDRAMFIPAMVGLMENGMTGVAFMNPVQINLALSSGEPMVYYLASKVIEHCDQTGVNPEDLAIDCTGTQGMLADVIEKEWKKDKTVKVHRVQFVGNPSDFSVSESDPTPAKKQYKNRVTELWFNMSEFARYEQIRSLPEGAAKEFCQRMIAQSAAPIMIEPKSIMKKRTGESPDEADGCVCVLDLARERLGIHPGSHALGINDPELEKRFLDLDVDNRPGNYLETRL